MEMKWIMTQFAYLQIAKKNPYICLKTAYDNLLFTDKIITSFFVCWGAGEIN